MEGTLLEIIQSFVTITASALGVAFIVFLIKKIVIKIVRKTPTKADDELVSKVFRPIYFSITIMAFYFAIKSLDYFNDFEEIVDKALYVIIALLFAYFFANFGVAVVEKYLQVKKGAKKTPRLIGRLVSGLVYLLVGIILLSYFGVEITPILATLGVGGIAIGLALQETLSNLFAGIQILSDKPVKVGDYIEFDNWEGYVEDINWRAVRLKTIRNNVIIIPNSYLANSVVKNNSMENKALTILVSCGVAYGSDLEKVEKIALEEAKKIQKKIAPNVKDFTPVVRYNEFGDSNINFNVMVRAEEYSDKYLITHEVIKALKKRFDAEKIEISWPVRKIVKG